MRRTFIKLTPYYGISEADYYINIDTITAVIDLADGGTHVYTTSKDFVCLESAAYIFETMSFLEE